MMWEKVKRLQGNRDLLRSAPNPATEAHKPRCGLHQLQDFYPETVAKILVSGGKTTFLLKSNEFPIEVSDHSNIPGLLILRIYCWIWRRQWSEFKQVVEYAGGGWWRNLSRAPAGQEEVTEPLAFYFNSSKHFFSGP